MNNSIFDLKRKLAFVAALAFMGNTVYSAPLIDAKAAPAVLAEPEHKGAPDVPDDAPPADPAHDEPEAPPADEPQPPTEPVSEAVDEGQDNAEEQGENEEHTDITYQVTINGTELDIDGFKEIAETIFGNAEAEYTFNPETQVGSATVSDDTTPSHNDIYPQSGDRKYVFVSEMNNEIVFDTYFRVNGAFDDDKVTVRCKTDDILKAVEGGFCKSGSVLIIAPTSDYNLDDDTAAIETDVDRAVSISRSNYKEDGYKLKVDGESYSVSPRMFKLIVDPNQFEVYFHDNKVTDREFKWKDVGELYLKANKKQAVYISCGTERQIIYIINDRFNGNTIALNTVIRNMPYAEIEVRGVDRSVTATAVFGEGEERFEKKYTLPVVEDEDNEGHYHMSIPYLADDGYCLSGYKYGNVTGVVNASGLYGALSGDNKTAAVEYGYDKTDIKLTYKKLANNENMYLFKPSADLMERGENCYAIGTRDTTARLMEFTPLFDGSKVIYDIFNGEEVKKKTCTFAVSGSSREVDTTLDNGESSDYFFVKNIISDGVDNTVNDSLGNAICFYYDRTAPKVRLEKGGHEGRWVGSEGISFALNITDNERCPVNENGDLTFDEREIVDVYRNYINKESEDKREIYSVVIGDYRFDRPAGGWTDTANIKGYIETDSMREALDGAAAVLDELDLSEVNSKYSGQLNYDGYYRALLRGGANELLADINAYYEAKQRAYAEANDGGESSTLAAEYQRYASAVQAYIDAAASPERTSKCAPVLTFDAASKKFRVSVKAEEAYAENVVNEELEIFALDNNCNSSRDLNNKKTVSVMIDGSKPVITGDSLKVEHAEKITDAQGAVAYVLRAGSTVSALVSDVESGLEGSGIDEVNISIGDIEGKMSQDNGVYRFDILEEAIRNKNIKTFISIFAKDKVHNPAEIKSTDPSAGGYSVIIDSAAPECAVSETSDAQDIYRKDLGNGTYQNWYKAYSDIKFALTAADQFPESCSGIKDIIIRINGEEHRFNIASKGIKTSLLSAGKYSLGFEAVPDSDSFKAYLWCSENSSIIPVGNEFTRGSDGSISVEFGAVDYADNQSSLSIGAAYVDLSTPAVSAARAEYIPMLNEGGEYRYAYFASGSAVIRVSVDEHAPSAGIGAVEVKLINSDGSVSDIVPEKRRVGSSNEWDITVPEKFKGTMKLRAVSNVGRVSDIAETFALVVENEDDHRADSRITLELPETPYKDKNGIPLYSDDFTAKLTVKDDFSGVGSVSISASGAVDRNMNVGDGQFYGDEADKWKAVESSRDHNIIGEVTREIAVKGNSNGSSINVGFSDNAGNSDVGIAVTKRYSIDKTDPVLKVAFTDGTDSADSKFKQIFKNDRKAVITVTERNFDEKLADTLADIRINGVKQNPEWKLISGTAGTDNATYQAEVPFEKDGTYKLVVNCTDMCGRKAKEYSSEEFIIDKTAPAMNIGFDKGIANDHYYNEPTTATFRISDDNFDPSRVVMTGTFNDSTEDFPKASEWTKSGSDYISTVKFEKDGEYTVNITGKDKAGNTLEAYNAKFCIDSQKPDISVSDVNAANNANEIRPHIQFNDANLDKDSIKIKLEGANRGKSLEFEGELRESENGYEYVFNNIPDDAEHDDIYTIKASAKDNAENKVEKDFRFSVNRYGSTFMLDEGTGEIAGRYISRAQDIVISEVNADKHSEPYSVYITKDSEMAVLKDNVDYRVEYSGGDDEWNEYKYIIYAKNFEKDGRYTVSIHSVDEAGNINVSTSEKKNSSLEFCVDSTEPLCIPLNISENSAYRGEKFNARMSVSDNIMLKEAKVFLDGKEIRSRYINNEYLEFVVPNSKRSQNVKVVLTDMAGNNIEYSYKNILVTTNAIRILAHKTWFKFACGGAVLLAGAAAFVIRKRKRRLL